MELAAGVVIADRFAIERKHAEGGMGVVYRARDLVTGEPVALKLLAVHATDPERRFAREAWVLAGLRHPAIVRYVDHGQTADGRMFLAMAWLDGEDLAARLARGPLPVSDALTLLRRVTEAVAEAHARGIVHRDIKPHNVFLVDRRVDQATLLDFGLASLHEGASTITAQGTVMGTPGYMAPEQARGNSDVGAPADVFALGCVLFECLTGQPAFVADLAWARLAKILFDEPPPASSLRSDVPRGVDGLLRRMLAKAPADRPADGASLLVQLEAIETSGGDAASPGAITATEIRLVSIVVARSAMSGDTAGATATLVSNRAGDDSHDDVSVGARLHRLAALHGGRLAQLPEGLAIATLVGRGAATDAAAQAARCALEMKTLLPDTHLVLTTARTALSGTTPLGTSIDRAAALLGDTQHAPASSIMVDPDTAGLLDARFEVVATPLGLTLGAERVAPRARTLLGRPSPFVGRDRERAAIDALIDDCLGEPVARVILLTGEAGVGKSRLWNETAEHLRRRRADIELWIGRGDPTSAGSSFGLVGRALRGAAGLDDGASLSQRQASLHALVNRHVPAKDQQRVAEFLGELVGTPFSDAGRDQLAAARQDPLRMGDQVRRAWEELVAATASDHPIVLVLEDLHWGDLPSVRLVDAALRHASSRPLLVLAVARPEVHSLFPRLWSERLIDEIRVSGLPRRGSEQLARSVLGDAVHTATIDALVERSAGNAFYLEELIRAAAEGRDAAPETVIAMIQTRLDALDLDARRTLRAASIFGQSCRLAGVAAVLGLPPSHREVVRCLDALRDAELLTERDDDTRYTFRHALVREAVYASLTDADRSLGHRLAARWLEDDGAPDALTLAEHLDKGDQRDRAVAWLERAAQQALEGNDFAAALALTERGYRSGATGQARGRLSLIATQANIWLGRLEDAMAASRESVALLARGTAERYRALGRHVWLLAQKRERAALADVIAELREGQADPVAETARFVALCQATSESLLAELGEASPSIMTEIDAQLASLGPLVTTARAWRHLVAAIYALRTANRASAKVEFLAVIDAFDAIGDRRAACHNRSNAGFICVELGEFEQAEAILTQAARDADRMGMPATVAAVKHNLGLALSRAGRWNEARAVLDETLALLRTQGYHSLEATALVYLSEVLLAQGELERAEGAARRACELLENIGAQLPYARATLARVLLRQGRLDEAAEHSAAAFDGLILLGGLTEGDVIVRLVRAEVLVGIGDRVGAAAIARAIRDRLVDTARQLNDAGARAFLGRVPENVEILALATALDDC